MTPQQQFDAEYRLRAPVLCGVDEAGRGPLAGPVCCAAVILDPAHPIDGIDDSKKLSPKKREKLYDEICAGALAWRVEFVDEAAIDRLNILWATMLGMKRAVQGLERKPDLVLIDGNRCPPELGVPCAAIVKGDAKSASIGAASILAKVSRDRYMQKLAEQYPQYKLEQHKGYPTPLHYEMIRKYGIQPFHRKSFLKNLEEHGFSAQDGSDR